jgi:hypothetical protein
MSEWFFRYRADGVEKVMRFATSNATIDAACRHIERGGVVHAIGATDLPMALADSSEIARIYEIWKRVRYPFGYQAISASDSSIPTTPR